LIKKHEELRGIITASANQIRRLEETVSNSDQQIAHEKVRCLKLEEALNEEEAAKLYLADRLQKAHTRAAELD